MKVIREGTGHVPPDWEYTCSHCGSLLHISGADFHPLDQREPEPAVQCPVCKWYIEQRAVVARGKVLPRTS